VSYMFGNAKAKGIGKINDKHRQYQSTMTFELTCVKKLWAKVPKPQTAVWGSMRSSDDSSDDGDNNDEMNNKDD
jgi:hypothetical protein